MKKGIREICVSSRASDWYLLTLSRIFIEGVNSLQLKQVAMIPPQWRWKLPGLVSSWSCFFINEDNPSFDVYLVGDLPVFCQVSVKMLQVIFIFARIHYGFSCYAVTVGQARVALTFHPIPGSPVAFETFLIFHRLEMSSRCVSCLHRFLF